MEENFDVDRCIAIVGVGAILPEALSAPAFWQNVKNKKYCIKNIPSGRWNPSNYYDPDPAVPDKSYTTLGSWVEGFDFDWKKYKVPPKVAAAMDIGQQWAVTIASEALSDFGYPQRPIDLDRTGVIIGTAMGGELHYITHLRISFPEYAELLQGVDDFQQLPVDVRHSILEKWHQRMDSIYPHISEDTMPGELANIVSGRIANVLNCRGPNFITDAACASALAAVDSAVEMLSEHHCDAVIAGGVDRNMGASSFIKFCKIGALSSTGSRPFGEGADGFVMGEGSAVFLLKRLADAERNGDKVYAVIRGVGESSDGKGKGITAPNPLGQKYAIERAWKNAGIDPATCTLVEAHGTSTKVGDVVEVESLSGIFGQGTAKNSIALGSAKSNIGHLKAGAGAAGLLKATMAIYEKVLPPTLNAVKPNPNIDFSKTPFFVNHELQEWKKPANFPRRAAVSAYGFGGTNFHLVLEEHIPGSLTSRKKMVASAAIPASGNGGAMVSNVSMQVAQPAALKMPVRGILALGANTTAELKEKLDATLKHAQEGWTPPRKAPEIQDINAQERLFIDYGKMEDTNEHDTLVDRLLRAQKAIGHDNTQAWKVLRVKGIYRGSGKAQGKIAFLFPGQGSQYVNMTSELRTVDTIVDKVVGEADAVMTPILGRPLTSYIFIDANDESTIKQAEENLKQTAITQPAMLTMDVSILRFLSEYGFKPDMVMGHSLGEYAALVAAGVMPFSNALEAAAARGREMTNVSSNMGDNGWMAAVFAPIGEVEKLIKEVQGYVKVANYNCLNQSVIGGESKAVEAAIKLFSKNGFRAVRIPVSHAFHTEIVAPASKPLRSFLDKLNLSVPKIPVVANLTGDLYPTTSIEEVKDYLEKQIASSVQWVKGMDTLYKNGVRTFVEVGPKAVLKGFVDDVYGGDHDIISIASNNPRVGELISFNYAVCALYAAGYGMTEEKPVQVKNFSEGNGHARVAQPTSENKSGGSQGAGQNPQAPYVSSYEMPVTQPVYINQSKAYDRNDVPFGSVVISGTGLGLPGAEKEVMDPNNVTKILRGEQMIDLIPERFRKLMTSKRVTRVVKSAEGSGSFETISDTADVIKLAGRPGKFDVTEEYGVPAKLVEALDTTTELAIAAGIEALKEAGIPLVQTYKKTTTGKYLPEKWLLPESMRDDTGVIFASAFPGCDNFAQILGDYYKYTALEEQIEVLEDLRRYTRDDETLREILRKISQIKDELAQKPNEFDRRFIFQILSMGHSQFAEFIGARGPNTQVNAACASTTQAVALAEDWVRLGRCRRVLVLGADNVTSDNLMEWIGAGFLATGAAATDDKVEEAALPFDKRRHGTILGMGACALLVESEDSVRERGMRGIVEILSTETRNSAFHGTRLNPEHISMVMNDLVTTAEHRFGLNRHLMAPQTVFVSHETYTPARGGSASGEIKALRHTFGDSASDIVISNTKGFTGHAMGAGVEDVIAVKILEHGIVPPVANYKEEDPELGKLTLSRGGRYPVQYGIHLAAGFGSQLAMSLVRRIPGSVDRVDNKGQYDHWLSQVSGYDKVELEVTKKTLRIKAQGNPGRQPAGNSWKYGTGPQVRTPYGMTGGLTDYRPAPIVVESTPTPSVGLTPSAGLTQGSTPTQKPAAPQPQTIAAAPVSEAPKPAPTVPKPVATPAAQPKVDTVADKVLQIVSEKTGYPRDMLDLDLDMEADLGVDTVKQAETFAAVREAFDIPRKDDMQLRDYPTLSHVIGFVKENRPDLAASVSSAPSVGLTQGSTPTVAGGGRDTISEKVLDLVAEKTGYPKDMLDLDLDLEADLGVDTVKQAETFAAVREAFDIPRQEDLQLRDYPTLGHVIGYVKQNRPDLAASVGSTHVSTPSVTSAMPTQQAAPLVGRDTISEKVLDLVAEKTGYPKDMLDLDLDLEADLGVDTVKQAETFAAVREAFDIPRQEDLQLRDYPTLGHVIGYVKQNRPDLAAAIAASAPSVGLTQGSTPTVAPTSSAPSGGLDNVADKVLQIVAEKTGYPKDMLELDLDLEADLGVDTVKQAETFASVREAFDIPRQDDLQLRNYPTLGHVIGFVKENRPDLAASAGSTHASTTPSTPTVRSGETDAITDKVLDIVAEKTGYPKDMLELDLDLEADLGVDTVKQAETFASVREAFSIPRQEDLQLRDYPTLGHVIGFVRSNIQAGVAPSPSVTAAPASAGLTQGSTLTSSGTIEDANKVPRRVARAALRPTLDVCTPTEVKLGASSRVIVSMDQGGVGQKLIEQLKNSGVNVLELNLAEGVSNKKLDQTVKGWISEGAIHGIYWLNALDAEPSIEDMDLATWQELNRQRVKCLYTTMRALYDSISDSNTFLVSATRMGGLHGYSDSGATSPLGGGVVGFTKAYKREQEKAVIKAVDFESHLSQEEIANKLYNEAIFDRGVVEVGYNGGLRYGVTLVEEPAVDGSPGMTLNRDTVFLVTGAAGGITSAIVTDLAQSSQGIFYLMDLTPKPDKNNPDLQLFRQSKDQLKNKFIADAKARGEKLKPVEIEKSIMSVEREEAALRAIESVEAAGGTVHYYSVNLTDEDGIAAVVGDIRNNHGKIDVLLHAGGIEISRALSSKTENEFFKVFDIKADGFFNILKAAKGMPIYASVAFSSVAGRFGNSGQTDYSSANDLLCKITSSFKNWRPETKGIAIDWTAWGGIGMATRGSIPKIMEMAGIDMLPPESGIPTVRRELVSGGFKGEIVVGQRLGILVKEWDEKGGADVGKLNQDTQKLFMIGEIKNTNLYSGVEAETLIDPNKQGFLFDHKIDNIPVLPGVMGVESFAEISTILSQGFNVSAVRNVEYVSPFKFYRDQAKTLYLKGNVLYKDENTLISRTSLKSITPPAREGLLEQEKLHFTAEVVLTRAELGKPSISFEIPTSQDKLVEKEAIYKIYFHGPAYQILEKVQLVGDKAIGWMPSSLPSDTNPENVEFIMSPRLIELCFQTAGIWEMSSKGVMALPLGIGSVTTYRDPSEASGNKIFAVVTAVNNGESFNAQVIDEAGNLYVDLIGYRTVQLPGSVSI
ncbi:MAG: SDR family NAD(P)-dependent oxidoreductase [Leptospiraceae bacterium]|nr:SDR family NAD(P)-dependent oxidoreductase [Leptospiraceae bacterium]MCP5494665.1 SDR family NAD(P)-dependent oxidoreductase [Leptospiraceae bacterium]